MTTTQAPNTLNRPAGLPPRPIERWMTPVRKFMHIESASGMVMLACTVVALILANSPLASGFKALWHTEVALTIGGFSIVGDLGHLVINDVLMTLFFFIVGLELKRELVCGELRDPRKALLPVVAALGGMVVPALIYTALQWGQPGIRGWAVPMATDIAFVVGFLALLGPRVPFSLKIILLSLAIVDDLGAVLVIAFVFTERLEWIWVAAAAAGFGLTYGMNLAGVRQVGAYVVVGCFIWVAVFKSGIHPTVAGVLLGLLTPSSAWIGDKAFSEVMADLWQRLTCYEEPLDPDDRQVNLQHLAFTARESISPLQRLETALHPWVAFGIIPLFALANAGVTIDAKGLGESVLIAVAAGLAIGKPVGILSFSWIAARLGWIRLPDNLTWTIFAGGACMAGIGFTMALFVNALAFPSGSNSELAAMEAAGKIGILSGSLISVILGSSLLLYALRDRDQPDPEND
jgi:NhaA family Na+:H+ antiporter